LFSLVADARNGVASADGSGFAGGTNVKGHLVKLNYSFTDSFTFSASCYRVKSV
jgi:hypothetical protein